MTQPTTTRTAALRSRIAMGALAALLALVPGRASAEATSQGVESSVVKVFSTALYPDPFRPWSKRPPAEISGSGVVVEGKRILTNAHVVLYASQIQVQANQSGDKITASVDVVAPGIDLALLKLDDESFFDTHPPLSRASTLPDIKDTVLAYGYPAGGDSLSITKGIVSRIEFSGYAPYVGGLRIQIDAAINPGNSGGPAVVGDKMIGLAFSHLGQADNIGYIIPCEEIELFLRDVADGRYDGKPSLYDELQTLENDALRSFLGLDKSVEGLVVHRVDSADPAYPLKEWDVLSRIGDTPIDDQGMIVLRPNLRVSFRYRVQELAKDGKVPVTIVRKGKALSIELPVATERTSLVPGLDGAYPSYFVWGPLVFTNATREFVGGLGANGNNFMAMTSVVTGPLVKRLFDRPAFDGEALVVVSSPLFPHRLSKGYGNPASHVVDSVNGIHVRNLAHLVELLRDATEPFVTIEFDGSMSEGLVFPRAETAAATEGILSDNGVRSQGSPDVMAVWDAKKAK